MLLMHLKVECTHLSNVTLIYESETGLGAGDVANPIQGSPL